MYEKPEEKHGFSRVREGPSASNSAARGVRAAKAEPIRSDCRKTQFASAQLRPARAKLAEKRIRSEVKVYLYGQ